VWVALNLTSFSGTFKNLGWPFRKSSAIWHVWLAGPSRFWWAGPIWLVLIGSVPLQGEYATDIEHGHLTCTTCIASIAGGISTDLTSRSLVLNLNPPGFQPIRCSWTRNTVSCFCRKRIKIYYNTDHGLDTLGSMPTLQEDDDTADVCPLVGKKLDQDEDEDEDVTDDEDDKDDGDEDEPEGHKDGSEKDDVERRDHRDGDIRLSGALLYCFIFSSLIAMFPHPTACPLQQSCHIKPQPLLLQHLTIQLQCIQALQVPQCVQALQLLFKQELQHLHTLHHLSIPFLRHQLHFNPHPPIAIYSISFYLRMNLALWGPNWTWCSSQDLWTRFRSSDKSCWPPNGTLMA